MSISIRPSTKLAAALLTAGVVATTPALVGSGPEALPVLSNVAVRPASFVTDALWGAGDAVAAVVDAVMIGTDLALGLNYYWDDSDFGWGVPTNPVFFAVAALQKPGSALSWLAQTYFNPSDNYVNYSYPWYFKSAVIEQLAGLLPGALSSGVKDAINGVADGINDALSNLPDPTPTVDSLWYQYDTTVGRLVYAVQNTVALPVTLLTALTYYLSELPGDLEATVESAIAHPADIPGTLSRLVWDALDPNLYGGLLGDLSYNLLKPGFFLPAPVGDSSVGANDGLVYGAYQAFADLVTGLLDHLPTPIKPTPFAAAAVAGSASAASAAATRNDTAATELWSADETDGTESGGQSADAPKAHAGVWPSRKAVTSHQKSAKASQADKSDGGATGGHGRSARAGKAGSAA
jgi:hypothetical protein